MMSQMQVREAKAAFSSLVTAAENGEPTVITRHGQPAAMVVPIEAGRKLYPDTKPSLADYLLGIPEAFEHERDMTPIREIDL
ncbi:type II toxin-antitoxin system Phd/YefM family antitoxin [Nevskia sp.]|uniref:type II toxin-antitoxin system Phd/YefM family antitoxin n=1 Tax=Nevskia sp. TaxID=1929292 RepID=UPI0025FE065A|nr:type II toxin-antitoxin system prevent-host-death family antitoxin [Nevskia sp.]